MNKKYHKQCTSCGTDVVLKVNRVIGVKCDSCKTANLRQCIDHWRKRNMDKVCKSNRKSSRRRQRETLKTAKNNHKPWGDDDSILLSLYGTMSTKELAIKMGRTYNSVAQRIARLKAGNE